MIMVFLAVFAYALFSSIIHPQIPSRLLTPSRLLINSIIVEQQDTSQNNDALCKTRQFSFSPHFPKTEYCSALEQGLKLEETAYYSFLVKENRMAEALLSIANFYLSEDKPDQAEHYYKLALTANAEENDISPYVYHGLGIIHEKRCDFENAEKYFTLAANTQNENHRPRFQEELGSFYRHQGDLEKAERHYTIAAKTLPSVASQLATVCEKLGKTTKAKHYKAISNNRLYHPCKKPYSNSHEGETVRSPLHYDSVDIEQYGSALDNNTDPEATELFSALVRNKGLAEAQYSVAAFYADNRNSEEAEYHYTLALKTNPQFADAHYSLGALYEKKCDLKNAEEHYIFAQKGDPVGYSDKLADFYERYGTFEKAKYYRALYADNHQSQSYYFYQLATLYEKMGDPEKAEQNYIASRDWPLLAQFYRYHKIYERAEHYYLLNADDDELFADTQWHYHDPIISYHEYKGRNCRERHLQRLKEEHEEMTRLNITPCKRRFYSIASCHDCIDYRKAQRDGKNLEDTGSYSRSVRQGGQAGGLCSIADFYLLDNNLERAKHYYTLATNLTQTLTYSDTPAEEKGDHERVPRSNSLIASLSFARAYFCLGVLAEEKSNLEEAERYYIFAMAHGGVWYRYRLGEFYEDQKDFKKAEFHYTLGADQRDGLSSYRLALLYEKMGMLEKAKSAMALAETYGYIQRKRADNPIVDITITREVL